MLSNQILCHSINLTIDSLQWTWAKVSRVTLNYTNITQLTIKSRSRKENNMQVLN